MRQSEARRDEAHGTTQSHPCALTAGRRVAVGGKRRRPTLRSVGIAIRFVNCCWKLSAELTPADAAQMIGLNERILVGRACTACSSAPPLQHHATLPGCFDS